MTGTVPLRQFGIAVHVARLAGKVDRNHDLRQSAAALPPGQLRFQQPRAHVVGARIDVDEVDVRAAVRAQFAEATKVMGEVQRDRPGPARARDRRVQAAVPLFTATACGAAVVGHRLLEALDAGPWVSQSERRTSTTACDVAS